MTLHEGLRICGSENSNPLAIGRAQFVAITMKTLDEFGGDVSLANNLYSSFDPETRDRARYDVIVGGMLVGNHPDLYKLLGFLGGDSHGSRFSDLQPLLKAAFALFGGHRHPPSLLADDVRELLRLAVMNEDDSMAITALWARAADGLFGVGARDRARAIEWDEFFAKLSGGVGEKVLGEFARQVGEYQKAVSSYLGALKNNK
jgi:hypothetical protein